jgi:hypothetical protein
VRHCTRGANTKEARVLIETRFGILQCQMKLADTDFNMIAPHGTGLAPRARYSSLGTHKITNTHPLTYALGVTKISFSLSPRAHTHIHTRARALCRRLAYNAQQRGRFVPRLMKNYAPAAIDAAGSHNSPFAPNPFQLCRETKSLCDALCPENFSPAVIKIYLWHNAYYAHHLMEIESRVAVGETGFRS